MSGTLPKDFFSARIMVPGKRKAYLFFDDKDPSQLWHLHSHDYTRVGYQLTLGVVLLLVIKARQRFEKAI